MYKPVRTQLTKSISDLSTSYPVISEAPKWFIHNDYHVWSCLIMFDPHYPPAIELGNGKSPTNRGLNGKIIHKWNIFTANHVWLPNSISLCWRPSHGYILHQSVTSPICSGLLSCGNCSFPLSFKASCGAGARKGGGDFVRVTVVGDQNREIRGHCCEVVNH